MAGSFDTIYALGSGSLPSGIAVIRISGPVVTEILELMCGGLPQARMATLRQIRAADGLIVDHGLVLYFPAPASFTGEDVAELHLHGGPAVVQACLNALARFSGTRPAEAGEFSRRAFLNGRIDLTEAEALADLVSVETEMQRRLALDGTIGRQRDLYTSWRRQISVAWAMIEAELDFSDEEDVPGSVSDRVWTDIGGLIDSMANHISGAKAAEIIRDGFRVVLAGAPNAGKSSLLNALAKRDVAIVTDEPGTTRDVLEVSLDVGGYKVIVSDTAGLREGGGRVELIGIERARQAMKDADLVIFLAGPDQEVPESELLPEVKSLVVRSKIDLVDQGGKRNDDTIGVSTLTGEGLDQLIEKIRGFAEGGGSLTGRILPARLRHADLVDKARGFLVSALGAQAEGLEIQAEHLRNAAHALGRITGDVDVEELLDIIFSEFCIGK